MRPATPLAALAVAACAALPLAGVASAQQPTTRDCRDFASQAAAQSALASGSGDPRRLDPNGDGVACEDYFRMADPAPRAVVPAPVVPAPVVPAPAEPVVAPDPDPTGAGPAAPAAEPVVDRDANPVRTVPQPQILVKPQGAPDTGDGSAAPGSAVALLIGAVAGLGAVGAVRRRVVRDR